MLSYDPTWTYYLPKLYIKEKGKYVPYQLPEPDVSDTAYKKSRYQTNNNHNN